MPGARPACRLKSEHHGVEDRGGQSWILSFISIPAKQEVIIRCDAGLLRGVVQGGPAQDMSWKIVLS